MQRRHKRTLGLIRRNLRQFGGRLRALTLGRPLPQSLVERLYFDQARDFSLLICAIGVVGANTVCLLFFDFMHNPGAWARNAVMASILLCYAVIAVRARMWLATGQPTSEQAKRYINQAACLLVVLGTLWAVLLYLLMRDHSPSQLCLLYGVMVGCLATPVLVAPVLCAFTNWAPSAIGIFFVIFLDPSTTIFTEGELISFIGLTGFSIFYLNRRMSERAIGTIKLQDSSEVIRMLLRDFEESASDWLWETDAELTMQRISPRLTQVARRPASTFTGRFPHALVGPRADDIEPPDPAIARLTRMVENRSPFRDVIVKVSVNGEQRYWSLTGKPSLDKFGRFAGYHGVGSDITGQRRQQEQIAFLARHDSLTKLPNRLLFGEVLHRACANSEASNIALLCLDLDHFKVVNDTLGHASGDALLVAASERLRGVLREVDVAARLGGDEFGVILNTGSVAEAGAIAERIIERVSRPYQFDGQVVHVGVSIGIAIAPFDSTNPNILMKNADLALYRAKSEGRRQWRFYDSQMDERLQTRRALQSSLRQALVRQEFQLEFQPVVSFADHRIVSAEALLRWQHPERGLLPPSEFISLAEESGLVNPIGEWVLHEACKAAANWPAGIGIAVNLSPLQFRDPGLVDAVERALSASGLAPNRLELEITETTVLETNALTLDALWKLHGIGVRIALDDFGTGYSSLGYLRRFPFDKIKIDRSFIRDLNGQKEDAAIILAIIGLAERMNMTVTAEGVETTDQAAALSSYGCGEAQGFLFHHPMAEAQISALIAEEAALGFARPAPRLRLAAGD